MVDRGFPWVVWLDCFLVFKHSRRSFSLGVSVEWDTASRGAFERDSGEEKISGQTEPDEPVRDATHHRTNNPKW